MSCKLDGSDLTANCQFGFDRIWTILGKKGCFWNFFRVLDYCQAAKREESFIWEGLGHFLKLVVVVWYYFESERLAKGAATHRRISRTALHTHTHTQITRNPIFSVAKIKKQLRNWACNSRVHGPHSTWRQPNLNHLGPEPVFTNYLSLFLFLSFLAIFLLPPLLLIKGLGFPGSSADK